MYSTIRQCVKEFVYRLRGDHTTEYLVKMGLKVGRNFKRLHGTILDPAHCWLITIGDNVTMAPGVHVLAHDASTFTYLGYTRIGRVTIGSNVFIGAGSVILPNLTIGDNVIIGANSTVTKDIPANSVAAGSPARHICALEDYLAKNRELMKIRPCYGEEYTTRKNIDEEKKVLMRRELQAGVGFVV
jgi:maltose O-acetyltransferase